MRDSITQPGITTGINPSDSLLDKHAPLKPIYKCDMLFAHQAEDVFRLWDAWEKDTGGVRDIPYWAVVWPGAVFLARYILENTESFKNKTILDFGCGGALCSIASVKAGASNVIANDIDSVALYIAQKNALANRASISLLDIDILMAKENFLDSIDVILVADMFYEKSKSLILLPFLYEMRRKNKIVLIADGQRQYAPQNNIEILKEEIIPVNFELEGRKERRVRILSLP